MSEMDNILSCLEQINSGRNQIVNSMMQIDGLIMDIRKEMAVIEQNYNRIMVECLKLK